MVVSFLKKNIHVVSRCGGSHFQKRDFLAGADYSVPWSSPTFSTSMIFQNKKKVYILSFSLCFNRVSIHPFGTFKRFFLVEKQFLFCLQMLQSLVKVFLFQCLSALNTKGKTDLK